MLALAALARASASRATCTSRRWPPVPPAVRLAARTVSVACVSSASDAGGDNNPFSGKGLGHRLREVALSNPDAVAVVTSDGEEITYGSLLTHAEVVAGRLRSAAAAVKDTATDGYEKSDKKKKNIVDANILRGARVAVSAVPGPEFVAAMHATWLCGAIAVPMACGASVGETAYVLRDARVSAWALVLDLTDTNTDTATAAVAAAGVSATLVVPPVPRKAQSDTRSNSSNSRRESRIGTSTVRENSVSASFANSPEKTDDDDGALIIYTSGTTGSPKGALHTHASLRAQCESLVSSWEWSPHDRILHVLPLHHIHGLVNAWMCAHFVGAVVEFGPSASGFSPRATWARLRKGLIQVSTGLDEPSFEASNEGFETGSSNSPTFGSSNSTPVAHTTTTKPITVFMGVPTMYVMLLKVLAGAKRLDPTKAAANSYAARNLRLAVSGSAAMPTPVMLDWQASTGCGELLLERYGMTEIGMALSNPLFGERTPGTVGVPLPGVAVKLAPLDLDGIESIDSIDSKQSKDSKDSRDSKDSKPSKRSIRAFNPLDGPGELLVKGPGVFREYWGRPEITADCFDEDGYFKTGDAVERVNGVWKILGRTSVDVLKTGNGFSTGLGF